jgi:hypothetical protein
MTVIIWILIPLRMLMILFNLIYYTIFLILLFLFVILVGLL